MKCRCLITLAGKPTCMHGKHAKYRQQVEPSKDCEGCPLKIQTGSQGEPLLPSLITQVKNLAADATKVVGSAGEAVSPTTRNARFLVCQSCPLMRANRCAACGCNVTAKTVFAAESCPLGYWEHLPKDLKPGDPIPEAEASPSELQVQQDESIYADPDTIKGRTSTCDTCPLRHGRRCKKCSCDIYTLARIRGSKCPENKWDS